MRYENWQESEPMNPRTEFDNLGTMVCFHKRYILGDRGHTYDCNDYESWDELEADIIRTEKPAALLPVYMYDHSGVTINTTGFSCPWDSGQIGFIFISKKKALAEYGGKIVTKRLRERLETYLRNEVETYDQYLRGDVWGYTIFDDNDEIIDSCGGFYGHDECEAEAVGQLAYFEGISE